jgi:hypothetical protein
VDGGVVDAVVVVGEIGRVGVVCSGTTTVVTVARVVGIEMITPVVVDEVASEVVVAGAAVVVVV